VGLDGHYSIGAIADRLLVGSKAATEVAALLGGLTLEDAAVWADCAKGVHQATLKYVKNSRFAECMVHETPDGIAAMEDYVTRNDRQCQPAAGDEICHEGYPCLRKTLKGVGCLDPRPRDTPATRPCRRPKQSHHSCETNVVTPPFTAAVGRPEPSNDEGF
jgi:hypothetical protein